MADAEPMVSEPSGMWGSDKINLQLGYHPATAATVPLYEANRAAAIAYACHLDATCPAGPELTLALRAVEESLMRANQAVAINLTPLEDPAGHPASPLVEQMEHDRLAQVLHLDVRIPDGLAPEDVATFIGRQVADQLQRSAAERSPRRVIDAPQA